MHILIRERINVWFVMVISRVCVTISDWLLRDHYSFIGWSISRNKVPHQPDVSWQCKQQLIALDMFTAGHNVKSMGFCKASLINKSWYEWILASHFLILQDINLWFTAILASQLTLNKPNDTHMILCISFLPMLQRQSLSCWHIKSFFHER